LRALAAIRLMASSRMSCADGSSSRSSPELSALAGLIRSWQMRAASCAANSAAGNGAAVAGAVCGESDISDSCPIQPLVGSVGAWCNARMSDGFLEPGVLVRHPDRPDWGVGQVQSVDGRRVTVNFEETGKQMIDSAGVRLVYVGPDPRDDIAVDDR
jgi:hypothetical protein